MCEKLIVEHCAPTLAAIKTANLVNAAYPSLKEMQDDLRGQWQQGTSLEQLTVSTAVAGGEVVKVNSVN